MEFVYVVERCDLFPLAQPQGFLAANDAEHDLATLVSRMRRHGYFVERRKAEEDSSLKQVIPYVVVRQDDHVLLLRRTSKQGESRLHGKRSIGVGGHINPIDTDGDALVEGLRRELAEELRIEGTPRITVAGCLNDDHTAVGSVHVGLVAVADARNCTVAIGETDKMEGGFVASDELRRIHASEPESFETWSALLAERLETILAADVPLDAALGATG